MFVRDPSQAIASQSDTVALNATDSLGGVAVDKTVDVTVNGRPELAVPATATVAIRKVMPIAGLRLSESVDTKGETFTVTLTDSDGKLFAAGKGVSGSATNSLTLSGTLAQVNAELATVKFEDTASQSDTIALNATDSLGGVAVAKTVDVTVNGRPAGVYDAASLVPGEALGLAPASFLVMQPAVQEKLLHSIMPAAFDVGSCAWHGHVLTTGALPMLYPDETAGIGSALASGLYESSLGHLFALAHY